MKKEKKKGKVLTMTNREFFENVITMVENAEMQEKAKSLIEALDKRNAQRKDRPSKTAIANAPIIKEISETLTHEPMLASVIAEKVGISTQKASALVKKVDGVQVVDVKVKGKGTQKGYFFAE